MPVILRPDLALLPVRETGPRRQPGTTWLAGNEIPYATPPSVLAAVNEAARETHRYPADSEPLIERLAAHLATDPATVAVGCGSVSFCHLLLTALAPHRVEEVVLPHPSFEGYLFATRLAGAVPRMVPLVRHRVDLRGMLDAITQHTRLMFLPNPCNPTSTALRADELSDFLDRVPDRVLVVLDEAFQEFVTDPEVADGLCLVSKRDNVVVLRTFSTAYRLAGLRVGYLVASPTVAAAVRTVSPAFSVNRIAQAAAIAAMDITPEILVRCASLTDERGRVWHALVTAGYEVPESQANFLWLPLGHATPAFTRHCAEHKIAVRSYAEHGVRVTVGLPDENDAFLAAAHAYPRR